MTLPVFSFLTAHSQDHRSSPHPRHHHHHSATWKAKRDLFILASLPGVQHGRSSRCCDLIEQQIRFCLSPLIDEV